MKKIAFVIESLHHGGAEKSLVTLLNLLNYKDLHIDLIVFKKGGEFEKFIPKYVNVKYISSFKETNRLNLLISRFKFWYLKIYSNKKKYHHAQIYWKVFGRLILKNETLYDIAIGYNQGFATYYVSEKIISLKKYAWLNTDYEKAGYNISFDYPFYRRYNKVICVSKESENALKTELKRINKELLTMVVKDICDIDFINKMSLENSGFKEENNVINILTVGRLAKAKGYNLAIQACASLVKKKYNIKWYIIGDGPLRKDIELEIMERKLQEQFILLGFKENPYPYIKTCDIYAQTSLFEGLGLTVIEAAILQKPIVTTNFPSASSIIEHNETGLICNMTPKDIANSIEKYIINEDFKNSVIKNLSLLKNNDKETSLKKIDELLNF